MVIFDLDMTLVDTSIAEELRNARQWTKVYDLINQMTLYPEMKQLSDLFHSLDIKIAVVTNSPSQYAIQVLRYFNLHYDTLVAYHDVRKRKPDTQPYTIALQHFDSTQVKKVLVFGDKLDDMIPAKKLNLISCACLWSVEEHLRQDFFDMDLSYYFHTPAEAYNCFSSMLEKFQ